jgi:hypothetical protein
MVAVVVAQGLQEVLELEVLLVMVVMVHQLIHLGAQQHQLVKM